MNMSDVAQCPRWTVTLNVRICMGRRVTPNESALTGVTLSLMAERINKQHVYYV